MLPAGAWSWARASVAGHSTASSHGIAWRMSRSTEVYTLPGALILRAPMEPPTTAAPVTRSGYVALLGRPNAGKSTLLNALVGEPISIVTPAPETTRDRVLAVITRPLGLPSQLVIVDTPGVHKAHRKLGEYMNAEARSAAESADVVVVVVDATEGTNRDDNVFAVLEGIDKPVFLAVNKVDRVRPRQALLPVLEAFAKKRPFEAIVPLSALNDDGVDRLTRLLAEAVPPGPALFPEDTLTDRPERFFVAERIREAVIAETGAEVPYVTAIEIESFDERPAIPRIRAAIHVERAGQKKIVIGAGGARIKAVGSRARESIEKLLGKQVFLELVVQVTPDWTRNAEALQGFGYATPPKEEDQ